MHRCRPPAQVAISTFVSFHVSTTCRLSLITHNSIDYDSCGGVSLGDNFTSAVA